MIIVNLDQGSPDWHKWRIRGLGSSDSSVIWYGQHFETDLKGLWTEKVGHSTQKKENSAMARGKRLEPVVRDIYQKVSGIVAEPFCATHDTLGYLKASLDGWCPLNKVLVEIKCPNRNDHLDALDNRVPRKYVPQLLHQWLISAAERIHYVSYNPHHFFPPSKKFQVVEIAPDARFKRFAERLLKESVCFWEQCVMRNLPPKSTWTPPCEELGEFYETP